MIDNFIAEGGHLTRDEGMCAMEWVAYLAGEPHSDRPKCVSSALRDFCVAFNDSLPDDERQRLRPYLPRMIGTRDDGQDEQRDGMVIDWIVRTWFPTWLELAGLNETAQRLRSQPPTPDEVWAAEREAANVAMRMMPAASEAASVAERDVVMEMVPRLLDGLLCDGDYATWMTPEWDPEWDDAVWYDVWDTIKIAAVNVMVSTQSLGAVKSAIESTAKQLRDSAFDLLDRMIDVR